MHPLRGNRFGRSLKEKTCKYCKGVFQPRKAINKFCNRLCYAQYMKNIKELDPTCVTDKLGDKNPNWAGDKVGYTALHNWVRRRLKKPLRCEHCQRKKPHDLANKGTYNRELKNWEWLCRSCHMGKDKRIYNLIDKNKTICK